MGNRSNAIFAQRKELKKAGHKVIRSHYAVLVILMLVMILFGTEFNYFTYGFGKNETVQKTVEVGADNPGSVLDSRHSITAQDVREAVATGRLDEGESKSNELLQQLMEKEESGALGRTNGVLATIVNTVGSGKIFVMLTKTLRSITKSDYAASIIFILGSFLLYLAVFIFLKDIYSAILRRVFLEARIYSNVPFTEVTHFAVVKQWVRAALTMAGTYFIQSLWNLTIVGGVIKRYSYWAVPYIVAENPTVKTKEAILLSRQMMNGHKLELFKYQLTLMGWMLLSLVTLGISDMLYGAAYRLACYTEFYTRIREEALEMEPERAMVLNDQYLFEKADRILLTETYFSIVDEITVLHENKVTLSGARKFISKWFGIWIGKMKEKKAYDQYEGRQFALTRHKMSMDGKAYPQWLCPLWYKRELGRESNYSYLRSYTIWSLALLFLILCFIGWSWEVALHLMQTGEFANRGTLHGPWLPIYGSGGIIVMLLCTRFRKNPVAEFFSAVVLCGFLEYMSAWQLEMKFHQRWWSYDGYFLNLHGRICAEGLLIFGIGCCAVVYVLAPQLDYLFSKVRQRVLIVIAAVLMTIYGVDMFYSASHPNMAKGAVETTE